MGLAQVVVLLERRARPIEGLLEVRQAVVGVCQQSFVRLLLNCGCRAAPDRLQAILRQAPMAQVPQRQQVPVGGEDVAAFAVQRFGRGGLHCLTNRFGMVDGRVQSVIDQPVQLREQLVELHVGGPQRLELMPAIELGQLLQSAFIDRREGRPAGTGQCLQGVADGLERLIGGLRQRQYGCQQQDAYQTECMFFVQRFTPGHPSDC